MIILCCNLMQMCIERTSKTMLCLKIKPELRKVTYTFPVPAGSAHPLRSGHLGSGAQRKWQILLETNDHLPVGVHQPGHRVYSYLHRHTTCEEDNITPQ